MPGPTFDLQAHSTHSDGALRVEEVVRRARESGIELLALTDHDSVAGVQEAIDAAAAIGGIRIVPGVEITALISATLDIHICGYVIDHHDPRLLDRLRTARNDRADRADQIAANLEVLGFTVDHAELDCRREAGEAVGRPHIAEAVLSHPDNAERLAAEGTTGADPFFARYLVPGGRRRSCRARRLGPRRRSAGSATRAASRSGRIRSGTSEEPEAVLARIDALVAEGLDGVEVFYAEHTREQVELLHAYCTEHGLLITGSGDFHGPNHDHFHTIGGFETYGLEPNLGPIADV